MNKVKRWLIKRMPRSVILYFIVRKMKKDPDFLTFMEFLIGISEFTSHNLKWKIGDGKK